MFRLKWKWNYIKAEVILININVINLDYLNTCEIKKEQTLSANLFSQFHLSSKNKYPQNCVF